jgi:GGDEF domain-containing protein
VARAYESIGGDKHGRLGDAVLLAVVGLLKAALDSDDPIQARHLELEVGLVGDGHELGKAWSIEEGVVDIRKVNDLRGEWLLEKVLWLAKGDVEPECPRGMASFLSTIP